MEVNLNLHGHILIGIGVCIFNYYLSPFHSSKCRSSNSRRPIRSIFCQIYV